MLMLCASPNVGWCPRSGWGCAVRCVAPTSALDVVAVGLADGRALLHNLRCSITQLLSRLLACVRVSYSISLERAAVALPGTQVRQAGGELQP